MLKKLNVVMLPTEKNSSMYLSVGRVASLLRFKNPTVSIISPVNNQHLYFYKMRDDYKVKIDEWVYDISNDKVGMFNGTQSEGGDFSDHCRKIIATTDREIHLPINSNENCPNKNCLGGVITFDGATGNVCKKCNPFDRQFPKPPQAFLNVYLSEYNKGKIINEVMVEDVNPKNNTMLIKKIKNKWTKEELGETIEYLLETIITARGCVRDKYRTESQCERIDLRLTEQIVKLREEGLLGS